MAQTLPEDVIREVFEHLAIVNPAGWISYTQPWFSLGWIAATHVCLRWRAIALDMPTLWADVVCAFPGSSTADELLARARSCPVKIEVSYNCTKALFQQRYYLPISWSTQHLGRANTFCCDIRQWSEFLRDDAEVYNALTGPLPSLRRLNLSCNTPSGDSPPPILKLNAPGLDLSLELESVPDTVALVADRTNAVHLDRLEILHVTFRFERHALDFLGVVTAPALRRTRIAVYDDTFNKDRVFAQALAQQQLLHAEYLSISESHVSISSWTPNYVELDVKWYSPDGWHSHYTAIVAALARCIDPTQVEWCEMECLNQRQQDDELDRALVNMCHSLSRVERLIFVDAPHPDTLRMLLAPEDESLVPMPKLETLCLEMNGSSDGKSASSIGKHFREVDDEDIEVFWWKTLKDVLSSRSHAGAPIQTLELGGNEWCTREKWTEDWTAESAECLSRGLISEVVDERQYTRKCSECRWR
ncbi:unnamed protein product [Peniophora sp. CBMAI 1063]|nr:unnamed protein product [Peniophora sp. CBMAI 1063]